MTDYLDVEIGQRSLGELAPRTKLLAEHMPGYVREPAEDYKGLWPKAFFLDLGGKDRYAPERGDAKNGGTWKNNRYGWGTDR